MGSQVSSKSERLLARRELSAIVRQADRAAAFEVSPQPARLVIERRPGMGMRVPAYGGRRIG